MKDFRLVIGGKCSIAETKVEKFVLDTGGDPGHERARYTYEKAGFELFPVARYFKKL